MCKKVLERIEEIDAKTKIANFMFKILRNTKPVCMNFCLRVFNHKGNFQVPI